jgi:hypothetical protein
VEIEVKVVLRSAFCVVSLLETFKQALSPKELNVPPGESRRALVIE